MSVDTSATLGDLVTADPRRARILERFGIDYCCSGERSLTDASHDAGLDLAEITSALDLPDATSSPQAQVPTENAVLAHDIVDTHHAYMWEEMPRLQALVDKVRTVHGSRHPELARVHAAYTEAVTALDPHMTTEERVVFPAISRFEKSQGQVGVGSFAGPIEQLRAEHDAVGDLFKEIRALTGGTPRPTTHAAPTAPCSRGWRRWSSTCTSTSTRRTTSCSLAC